MKTKLYILFFILFCNPLVHAQITTPALKANFGVDADLRANYFNGAVAAGGDDWFNKLYINGLGVIDTTGAAGILAGYTANPATRMQSFLRHMSVPGYSVVSNNLLLDALFCRDFHGDDSTVFASGSNKNGMSPASWTCPVAQSIPDKNDILDAFTHIRRQGPTVYDSLWMFGGVSIENTTGNRYFDFELYQTDISYDRGSRTFSGYGPDAGHTAWLFDAAGNVLRAGDIIFSAEYSSSSLTLVEARIWVNRNVLSSVTPANFNWGGLFDGAGSGATYGYASISPKTSGAFYTGLQSAPNVWAGPYWVVRQDNSVTSVYDERQFMEFSVNLSKLGLDPGVFANNPCALPFRRMMIKSRASTSFTAELKDFVAPFRLFEYPAVNAFTDIVYQCRKFLPTTIDVINPLPNSTYTWTTRNGIIIGPDTGRSIVAGSGGTYQVIQRLNIQCPQYATDSVVLMFDSVCRVMNFGFNGLTVQQKENAALLNWTVSDKDNEASVYVVEQSTDGNNFSVLARINANNDATASGYSYTHSLPAGSGMVYYRVKAITKDGAGRYSETVTLKLSGSGGLFYPNPTRGDTWFVNEMPANETVTLSVWDMQGKMVATEGITVHKGMNRIKLNGLNGKQPGYYLVKIKSATTDITGRIMLMQY